MGPKSYFGRYYYVPPEKLEPTDFATGLKEAYRCHLRNKPDFSFVLIRVHSWQKNPSA